MTTFLEMQTAVSYRLGDPANKRHTLTKVKASLNGGYEILCESTGCYETNLPVNLTTSPYYNLGTLGDILKVRHIYNSQTNFWLVPASTGELDRGYWRWRANSGSPDRFLMHGLHQLRLYPKSSVATGSVVVYGTSHAPAMSADSDTPCFPEEFHDALEHYAVYDRLVMDGEIEKGMIAYKQFEEVEAALMTYINDRGWDASEMSVGDGGSGL